MKKRIWVFVFILLLAVFIFYAAFVSNTIEKNIVIPVKSTKTLEFINNPEHVIKWYLPFAKVGIAKNTTVLSSNKIVLENHYLELNPSSLIKTVFIAGNKNDSREFLFQVIPDISNTKFSNLSMTYKSTLFQKWFGSNELEKNARNSFENLKKLLESTKNVYGYPIEKIKVVDTSFLFSKATIRSEQFRSGMEKLFNSLVKYAAERKAGYNGVRIFHFSKTSSNEVDLFAGIGITHYTETKPGDAIQYKMMPPGKNLLVAYFEGPYKDISKAYAALEEYKKINGLVSMALPFQKFITDGYAFADTQVVKILVNYPIL